LWLLLPPSRPGPILGALIASAPARRRICGRLVSIMYRAEIIIGWHVGTA
jgi:hypothetical protein